MEDMMHIQSAFLKKLVSAAANKVIRKQGYKSAEVRLNDIFACYGEKDGKLHVHLDVDADISREELMDILEKAGVV